MSDRREDGRVVRGAGSYDNRRIKPRDAAMRPTELSVAEVSMPPFSWDENGILSPLGDPATKYKDVYMVVGRDRRHFALVADIIQTRDIGDTYVRSVILGRNGQPLTDVFNRIIDFEKDGTPIVKVPEGDGSVYAIGLRGEPRRKYSDRQRRAVEEKRIEKTEKRFFYSGHVERGLTGSEIIERARGTRENARPLKMAFQDAFLGVELEARAALAEVHVPALDEHLVVRGLESQGVNAHFIGPRGGSDGNGPTPSYQQVSVVVDRETGNAILLGELYGKNYALDINTLEKTTGHIQSLNGIDGNSYTHIEHGVLVGTDPDGTTPVERKYDENRMWKHDLTLDLLHKRITGADIADMVREQSWNEKVDPQLGLATFVQRRIRRHEPAMEDVRSETGTPVEDELDRFQKFYTFYQGPDEKWYRTGQDSKGYDNVQLYADKGNGSYAVVGTREDGDVTELRIIEPQGESFVKLRELLSFDGEWIRGRRLKKNDVIEIHIKGISAVKPSWIKRHQGSKIATPPHTFAQGDLINGLSISVLDSWARTMLPSNVTPILAFKDAFLNQIAIPAKQKSDVHHALDTGVTKKQPELQKEVIVPARPFAELMPEQKRDELIKALGAVASIALPSEEQRLQQIDTMDALAYLIAQQDAEIVVIDADLIKEGLRSTNFQTWEYVRAARDAWKESALEADEDIPMPNDEVLGAFQMRIMAAQADIEHIEDQDRKLAAEIQTAYDELPWLSAQVGAAGSFLAGAAASSDLAQLIQTHRKVAALRAEDAERRTTEARGKFAAAFDMLAEQSRDEQGGVVNLPSPLIGAPDGTAEKQPSPKEVSTKSTGTIVFGDEDESTTNGGYNYEGSGRSNPLQDFNREGADRDDPYER